MHFLDNRRSVRQLTHLSRIRPLKSGDIDLALGGGIEKVGGNDSLLCVSNPAHDIYSGLRDRDGHLCCGGQDCEPVEAIGLPDGNYYLPGSDEIIPADMATPSPDDRFHHCFYYPLAKVVDPWGGPVWEDKPKTRCFFAPMNSS